ncbi:AbrB/MazE/SpoVT family DNA-binding domain-containing protein [bacterium]|nr:AbrB/MazE/SpoVT family DNA-binding domain-containing protein [bacterium]
MRTKVTTRGQVSIPAPIRRQLNIKAETTLEWIVEGATARVIPLPDDPLAAFRGSGRGGTVKQLLGDRRRDRARDA